jgi:predicted negative regulator of RcsB-dependent stress response
MRTIYKWLIAGVIVVIAGFWLWQWRRKLKELERLRTKVEQDKIRETARIVTETAGKSEAEVKKIEASIDANLKALEAVQKAALKIELDHQAVLDRIESITTWEELDAFRKAYP